MTAASVVDGLLAEWGERFYGRGESWGPPFRAPPGAKRGSAGRPGGGASPKKGGALHQAGGRLEARAVRARLVDLVSKSPQVMVKVYGGGRGMKQIRAHLRYIARAGHEGEVPIEDQDGFRSRGVEAIRELGEDWQYGEVKIEEVSDRREALNIVLSMPEGTDPIAVQKAARDFAAREFKGHKYAMALHTIDTPHYDDDKEDPPSPHPHVHLVVRSSGKDGTRLNPRKADLHRWREGFAQALREHGVDAVATSRAHRLNRRRGDKQAVRQMKDKSKSFTKSRRRGADDERVDKARRTEQTLLRRYAEVTRILGDSDDPADRVLARALADRFGLDLPEPTPPEKGRAEDHDLGAFDRSDRALPRRRSGADERER